MYVLEPEVSVSILFTETGCIVRAKDLNEDENYEIGFLVYGEEVGDFDFHQYNVGMVMVCNKILHRLGLLFNPYRLEDMYHHRRNMIPNLN